MVAAATGAATAVVGVLSAWSATCLRLGFTPVCHKSLGREQFTLWFEPDPTVFLKHRHDLNSKI